MGSDVTGPSPSAQTSFWQLLRQAAVPMLITFLVVGALGAKAAESFTALSIVDEFQHLDMTARASEGDLLVPAGTKYEQEAMEIAACRGKTTLPEWPPWPECGLAEYQAEKFQDGGVNTAAGRVSLYYLPTAITGRVVDAAFDRWDFLGAARIANVLALAVGAAMVSLMTYVLSRSKVLATGLGLLCGLVPPMLVQGVSVNPDSWSLLGGTLVTSLALARHRIGSRRYILVMALVILLAASIKPNFVTLAVIPLVFALADYGTARRTGPATDSTSAVWAGAVFTMTAGVAFLASIAIPRLFTVPGSPENPANYLEISEANPWDSWDKLGELLQAPFPFTSFYSPSVLLGATPVTMLSVLVGLVLMAPTVVALSASARASREFLLATATIVGLLTSALLVIVGQLLVGQSFDYPQRYGLVMLPAAAAVAAAMPVRRVWPYVVTTGLTVAIITAALWELPPINLT